MTYWWYAYFRMGTQDWMSAGPFIDKESAEYVAEILRKDSRITDVKVEDV